jgi:hypothetical protein
VVRNLREAEGLWAQLRALNGPEEAPRGRLVGRRVGQNLVSPRPRLAMPHRDLRPHIPVTVPKNRRSPGHLPLGVLVRPTRPLS